MVSSTAGMSWWLWERAQHRLVQWLRTLIHEQPYDIRFASDGPSYVDFGARRIVVTATMPDTFAAHAKALPTTWGSSPVVRHSTLQVLCARALAYHEGGHVLFTSTPLVDGPSHAWLLNVLEDERSERLTARHYPAASRDFRELGHRVWLSTTSAATTREARLLQACLVVRWDRQRPAADDSKLDIPPDDQSLWDEQIYPLVEQAWEAPCTEEVATLARAILQLLGMPAAERLPSGLLTFPDSPTHGVRQPADGLVDAGLLLLNEVDVPAVPALPEALDAVDTTLPDHDPSDGQLWLQPYAALEAEVAGAVRRLSHALEVATPDTEALPSRRGGRFNARAFARSRGTTPLLHVVDEADTPEGLAITLLIDGTSSMGGHPGAVIDLGEPADPASFERGRMPHVRRAVMLFERTCARLEVPLCIGFARDEGHPVHLPGGGWLIRLREPVIWLRTWETPRNAEGPRALIAGLYGDAEAEAVSRSLQLAQAQLDQRSEAVKLILYLHDGNPTDESPEQVATTIQRLRRTRGVVIIGLFLGNQSDLPQMQAIFGRDWTIGVEELQQLPARLGRILARYRETR